MYRVLLKLDCRMSYAPHWNDGPVQCTRADGLTFNPTATPADGAPAGGGVMGITPCNERARGTMPSVGAEE